jgi:hypothetical protein
MTEEMVTVAVFGSPFEAGMARSELESFGIPVFVADEFTIGANHFYSNALGGVKVNVPASYAEEARQILSVEVPNEDRENSKPEDTINTHKEMAKSFVWLYFGLAAISIAVLISVLMIQD